MKHRHIVCTLIALTFAECVFAAEAGSQDSQGRKGYWREEAGILKFFVGRDPERVSAEAREAYERPAGGRTWKITRAMTLEKVNELDLMPGDKVLFERGGVWRGQLQPRSGKPGHPIVYGAFGEGDKPIIEPAYDMSCVANWRMVDGLWVAETGASADIGNIVFDNGANGCAFKRCFIKDVSEDLDFWCDPKTFAVHVKSDANPATRFKSIELCEKIHCIDETRMHDVMYDVRYGNGIEFWSNCEDVLVESNRVWECWDAGLTNQSNEDGAVQKNVVWRGNEVWNCEYSYEYWQQGDRARTENVVVENNIFRDAGKGWGHRQRWNPNAAHLMFYDTTAETKGFVVRRNVFSRSENTLFRLFNDWRSGMEFSENKWIAESESICRFHGRPTANLVFKYPDRLDQMHDDNLAEIEAQTVSKPRVFKSDELDLFRHYIHSVNSRDWHRCLVSGEN